MRADEGSGRVGRRGGEDESVVVLRVGMEGATAKAGALLLILEGVGRKRGGKILLLRLLSCRELLMPAFALPEGKGL